MALAFEELGELLRSHVELPSRFRRVASSLADGKSVVPADGEVSDWPGRLQAVHRAPPAGRAAPLRGWLGDAFASWLSALVDGPTPEGWVLRGAVDVCAAARNALREHAAPVAGAYATWYSAGSDEAVVAVIATASSLALDEAIDRWVALGFDADLPRYVGVWQRSSSRWVERVVGTAVDVSINDLGALRSLRVLLTEFAARRVPKAKVAAMAAQRLDVTEDEVHRLLSVESAVAERIDPTEILRRRASVVRPIARAAAELSSGDRTPTVAAVARRAKVHPALVELCLDALGTGSAP